MNDDDYAVVELSSFQLISMRKSPDIAVVTNLAPNHLDIHKDMQEYIDSKKNIILHQNAFSKAVLNLDNEITNGFSDSVRGQLAKFSVKENVSNGAFLDGDTICYNDYGKITRIMNIHDIKIPGMYNVENYLAAISAVWGLVDAETMTAVAKTFGGVAHRAEFVRRLTVLSITTIQLRQVLQEPHSAHFRFTAEKFALLQADMISIFLMSRLAP